MQAMGIESKQAKDLLLKWSRGLRLFEEHSRRCVAMEEPVFHKFSCDLHVLVARHTVDFKDMVYPHMSAADKAIFDAKRAITGGDPDEMANWGREAFKAWEQWTEEDFVYHEVETDHMTIKNSPLMVKIVFQELASFCGMEYVP